MSGPLTSVRAALEVLRLLVLVYFILAVFTGDRILLLTMPSSVPWELPLCLWLGLQK